MTLVTIGGREIGEGHPTFVIAEAGSNHNGELETAKELVQAAAEAGADAVKFQTFRSERLYGGPENEELRNTFSEFEMPYEWISELQQSCSRNDVLFLSTPFDKRSADEILNHVPAFKIASLTASHEPLLRHIAGKGKPVILSTGAQELEEVRDSVSTLRDAGVDELVLLQCVSSYPPPLEKSNVRVVTRLREEFDVVSGLSDHSLDPVVAPTASVALGGDVVEKHFTLDSSLDGLDHSYALEPDELERMIGAIRDTERCLGNDQKTVLDIEREVRDAARRSIQATTDIRAGDSIQREDIAILRSGNMEKGIEPKYLDIVLGANATSDISKGQGIKWDRIEEVPK
jgi:N-acetylneuraminate synthase